MNQQRTDESIDTCKALQKEGEKNWRGPGNDIGERGKQRAHLGKRNADANAHLSLSPVTPPHPRPKQLYVV